MEAGSSGGDAALVCAVLAVCAVLRLARSSCSISSLDGKGRFSGLGLVSSSPLRSTSGALSHAAAVTEQRRQRRRRRRRRNKRKEKKKKKD